MNATKLGSLLFILLIAVVFTLQFGPGSSGCGAMTTSDAKPVATVNGEKISAQDFRRAYANQLFRLRQAGIPESQAKLFGLPQQTLNGLVDATLLAQAAERHGIKPSDEELRKELFQIPAFHNETGKFDYQRYRQEVTQRFGKTPQSFEQDLREELAASRMLALVEESAAVSESEVKSRFLREQDQVQLQYVRFLPAQFTAQVKPPTAQELAAFKTAQEAAIKADFEQNQFSYSQPERAKARQILVKFPENATEAQKNTAKEKAQNLKQQLEGGADFAELAKKESDDAATRANGGDLGFVERGGWDATLAEAAFALQPGQVTAPVETRVGVHLVKVEEKQPAKKKELAEVSDEIAKKLWNKERAKELAKAAAEGALVQAKTGKTLAQLYPKAQPAEGEQQNPFAQAPSTKPEASDTQAFSVHTEFVPTLGPAPELVRAATAVETTPATLDQVFPVGEGFVVAQVTLRQRASDQDFTAKKDQMRDEALNAKKFELRDQYLKSLREGGQVQTNQDVVDSLIGQG